MGLDHPSSGSLLLFLSLRFRRCFKSYFVCLADILAERRRPPNRRIAKTDEPATLTVEVWDHVPMAVEYPGLSAEFQQRFRIVTNPAMLRAERAVIGADYGASSYTTLSRADHLAERLDLAPGKLLLDVGSGPGWPGSYLSKKTGCGVILTDPTEEGMTVAAERSRRDNLDASQVVAEGSNLPFHDRVFDAATSSDVFC